MRAGSLGQDLGVDADPDVWARQGGLWGGVAGIVLFIEGAESRLNERQDALFM
jgi:hypothetical protein